MSNKLSEKLSKADLDYLKEHFPEEAKILEKSNSSDLISKNLPSEVTRIVQKNDDTILLESKPQPTQEQALNPEPEDTRSQVEKLFDRLHDNPKELAAELAKEAKNNPNMGDELIKAMDKYPNLAEDLAPHMPQLQIAQNPPRWVVDSTTPEAVQQAEQEQAQAAQSSFGM